VAARSAGGADYDTVRVQEIGDCRAGGEEFGVGEDFEGGVWSVSFELKGPAG
jgi:hypothetical protein